MTTGIPSLFLIFSVLCLVILSLMSLGTSRTDRTSSRNSLEQTEKYYEACTKASHRCAQIQEVLTAYQGTSGDDCMSYAETYLASLSDVTAGEDGTYILSVPFTPFLSLHVNLQPATADSASHPNLMILDWYTVQDGEWTPDLHQSLFIPGQTSLSSE